MLLGNSNQKQWTSFYKQKKYLEESPTPPMIFYKCLKILFILLIKIFFF